MAFLAAGRPTSWGFMAPVGQLSGVEVSVHGVMGVGTWFFARTRWCGLGLSEEASGVGLYGVKDRVDLGLDLLGNIGFE